MPKSPVTSQNEQMIRKSLCYPLEGALPRCPARDRRKMRKFESVDDFSHSADFHVCAECRCDYVAGYGTWLLPKAHGFWGDDLAHCGTYGVGFCAVHTFGCHKTRWLERAISMRKLLQQQGMSEKVQFGSADDLALELKKNAEVAVTGIEMRNAMARAHEFLEEFIRLTNDGETELTEPCKDGSMPMTDKTRYSLIATLTKAAASIASSKWKIEASSMIHIDEVKKRVWDTYRMTLKHVEAGTLTTKEQFNEGWFREMQAIWSSKGI